MKFLRCSEGLFLGLRCKIIENPKVLTLQMSLNKKIHSGLYGDRNGGCGYTTKKIKGCS